MKKGRAGQRKGASRREKKWQDERKRAAWHGDRRMRESEQHGMEIGG
jgi:hypothetical protein